jgi:cell division protein FtsI/penicillin-binding protein 2
MLPTLVGWLLRALLVAFGVAAAAALVRWVAAARSERREPWPVRLSLLMLLLAGVYAIGHARLLVARAALEEGQLRYARYGDPRRAEQNRAEVRGWILDCTGGDDNALARYAATSRGIERTYPLGEAGANLIGGGKDAEQRDYTVERLFAARLREPASWGELGEPHPAGRDLRLTLCAAPTRTAARLLRGAGRPGAVVVQDVATGALVAYAATGAAEQAPLGIKRYAPPGSVWKLALAALWWERGLPDEPLPCPASIEVTPRATISNYGGVGRATLSGPAEMLVFSCNTAAVRMALQMRERLGSDAFVAAYRRFGFAPYSTGDTPPADSAFWRSDSRAWEARMSPPPARIRISDETGPAEWAQLAIGQGPVDVTPIAVSRFLQAIGNGGVMLPPTLEAQLAARPPDGERIMSGATARKLQAAMLETVERGTAKSAGPKLAGVPGALGGKTGTAQVRGARDDGWFAGLVFDAAGRPRYTVVVYLRGGGPGGSAPAGIAAGMARELLTAPPA